MAIAPFFAKTLQSASQVLADFDEASFTAALDAHLIAVAWDDAAAGSAEGRATLELLTDLLARLYPRLAFAALSDGARGLQADLERAAHTINPSLEIVDDVGTAAVVIVIGRTALTPPLASVDQPGVERAAPPCVMYAGSDGWTLRFSRRTPVGCGASDLVFAAGAAACVAAANVFRYVFSGQLSTPALDDEIVLSLLAMEPRLIAHDVSDDEGAAEDGGLHGPLDVGEVHLVGIGAIGHGAVWAWRRTSRLRGTFHLVDGEAYDDTNPQRYADTPWNASGLKAATAAARLWASPDVVIIPHTAHWEDYITDGGPSGDWCITRAALALDSAKARVMVQASLPRAVHNAWTRPENLGLSRHDFLAGPCVACLYVPDGPGPNRDEVVARALGMSTEPDVHRVRLYLDSGAPLEPEAIDWVADRLALTPAARSRALQFVGQPLEVFYTQGLCGGAVVPLSDLAGRVHAVEVPLAFQSALAGVLLAADVVVEACGLRRGTLPARTEVNLLAPLGRVLNSPQGRPASGVCLCQDAEFINAYRDKYAVDASIAGDASPV